MHAVEQTEMSVMVHMHSEIVLVILPTAQFRVLFVLSGIRKSITQCKRSHLSQDV